MLKTLPNIAETLTNPLSQQFLVANQDHSFCVEGRFRADFFLYAAASPHSGSKKLFVQLGSPLGMDQILELGLTETDTSTRYLLRRGWGAGTSLTDPDSTFHQEEAAI